MTLTQKTIVITGGTSGVGRQLVRQLHDGNALIVVARSADRLHALASEHDGLKTVCADLGHPDEVVRAAKEVLGLAPRIDVLINNAAVQHTPRFASDNFDPHTIVQEINTNLTAPCLLIAHLLSALDHGDEAIVLNVNSGLALTPKTDSAVYCATKAGLDSFSQSLSYQLEGSRIRVQQAFLPLVDTGMAAGRGTGKLTAEYASQAVLKGIRKGQERHDIGKVRVLRKLVRWLPGVARRIIKAS